MFLYVLKKCYKLYVINYSKMHGAGNDFVIIDDRSLLFNTSNRSLIKKICNRSDGLGSDGLILLQKSDLADIRMRFFNCDGVVRHQCVEMEQDAFQFLHKT